MKLLPYARPTTSALKCRRGASSPPSRRAASRSHRSGESQHRPAQSAGAPSPASALPLARSLGDAVQCAGAAGLLDGKSPGQPSKLNDVQRQAIVRMIESGPIPAIHGVVRWRLIDLSQWIYEEFRITVAKQTLSRELRAMGYRKLSARPRHHAQAEGAIED